MKKGIASISFAIIMAGAIVPAAAGRTDAAKKSLLGRNRVAVIKSRYDMVDAVLDNFHIPYDILKFRDLENPGIINRYRAVFVPSGIDTPLEESLDIFANAVRYKSVALKPDFYEVDEEKVAKTIRQFVKGGGSAYFSGYSFEYLQKAFNIFEYFDNFPYMGMPARVEAVLDHDLSRFSMKNRMALYLDHPGWITIKSVEDSEVIAYGTFETPRGVRTGPISITARRGSGEILYTSYDGTLFSAFRRFNIYRIAGAYLLKSLESAAWKWNQRVTGRLVDSLHRLEFAGMHRIDLEEGENTIYFHSGRDCYQIDIIDKDQSLIESRDLFKRDQIFSIRSPSKGYCYIKLYPSAAARYGMYAVVSAAGMRIFPYFYQFIGAMIGVLAVGAAVKVYRLFLIKGYSGRWRG